MARRRPDPETQRAIDARLRRMLEDTPVSDRLRAVIERLQRGEPPDSGDGPDAPDQDAGGPRAD